MPAKEAKAHIKINKLLEEADWRFFDSAVGKANISLEHRTKKGKFTGDKLESRRRWGQPLKVERSSCRSSSDFSFQGLTPHNPLGSPS